MRRKFLLNATGLALGAAVGTRIAGAQPAKRLPRVAYVWIFNDGPSRPFFHAFNARMADLGWVDGKTVAIETRNAAGDPQKLAAIMRELVDSKVDVIVGSCTPEVKAAVRATSTIPIVVAATGDPVASGFAASLARPGGNVTGVSGMWLEQSAKRVALLKEVAPSVARATIIWNPERPDNKPEVEAMLEAGKSLGVALDSQQVRSVVELTDALGMLTATRSQGLLDAGDNLIGSTYPLILEHVNRARLPTVFEDRYFVDLGGLMSYGPNIAQMHARAADYVDKILRGANPATMPFEQPRKFELVVSLKAARSLGLTLPPSLLQRADDVVS